MNVMIYSIAELFAIRQWLITIQNSKTCPGINKEQLGLIGKKLLKIDEELAARILTDEEKEGLTFTDHSYEETLEMIVKERPKIQEELKAMREVTEE